MENQRNGVAFELKVVVEDQDVVEDELEPNDGQELLGHGPRDRFSPYCHHPVFWPSSHKVTAVMTVVNDAWL